MPTQHNHSGRPKKVMAKAQRLEKRNYGTPESMAKQTQRHRKLNHEDHKHMQIYTPPSNNKGSRSDHPN